MELLHKTTIGYKNDVITLEKLETDSYLISNGCSVLAMSKSYLEAWSIYDKKCTVFKRKRTRELNRTRNFLKENKDSIDFELASRVLQKNFHISEETACTILKDAGIQEEN